MAKTSGLAETREGLMEIAKEIGELRAKNQLVLERIERLEKLFLDHLKTADAHHPAIIKN